MSRSGCIRFQLAAGRLPRRTAVQQHRRHQIQTRRAFSRRDIQGWMLSNRQ